MFPDKQRSSSSSPGSAAAVESGVHQTLRSGKPILPHKTTPKKTRRYPNTFTLVCVTINFMASVHV